MLEKKRQDKIKTVAPLEKTIAEILVANGRSIEPFVKVFTYSGENVTKSPLGTLVGVFEIAQQSEDSAYIVNFLASVAKKEYFNNPRRSAIESFEAALHKINLALAELVKNDNIAWLGKFHGALGILEKNNLHFSVTGKAEILLLRNNSFSEISAGLASPESHTHPIKTFVEVSSGRLMPKDKVIFTSPELLELLPIEDLEKNALRMDGDHFGQFLRTVLINELDMAGTIVIDFQEGVPIPPLKKQEEKSPETTHNVFSQKAFTPKAKVPETDSFQKEVPAPEEYVDSKTGHIYVQGDTLGKTPSNQNLERVKLSLQNMLHGLDSFFASQGKLLRKGKKYGLILFAELAKKSNTAAKRATRFLRRQLRKKSSSKLPASSPREVASQVKQEIVEPMLIEREGDTEIPPFMRAKLDAFYQKNGAPRLESLVPPEKTPVQNFVESASGAFSSVQKISQKCFTRLSSSRKWAFLRIVTSFRRMLFFLRTLSSRQQKTILFGSIIGIIIFAGAIFLSKRPPENTPAPIVETPQLQIEASAFPLDTEKNARLADKPLIIATKEDRLISATILDNDVFFISSKSIISVWEDKTYLLPVGSGSIQFATSMDHLSLIFIYTDTGELFAWSPISRTFIKNTLALPVGATVKDIGAYLTYLYVLDASTNQIYRFPRAEGGFGQGSAWLKDSVVIESAAKMAVNETIFLAPNDTSAQAFFRGRFVKNLESPDTPLSVASLYTHPGLANVYALDAKNKRVLVWNQDGVLLAQYFSDTLADAKAITVNEKTGEIFLTTQNTLLSFKITGI